jgi:hypothetical protein
VAGFPYPAAVRLFAVGEAYWPEIDGTLAGAGIDPFDLSPERLINFIYSWAIGRFFDADARTKWLTELHAPLDGADPDKVPESVQAEEMSMFYALKRQTSPGGG